MLTNSAYKSLCSRSQARLGNDGKSFILFREVADLQHRLDADTLIRAHNRPPSAVAFRLCVAIIIEARLTFTFCRVDATRGAIGTFDKFCSLARVQTGRITAASCLAALVLACLISGALGNATVAQTGTIPGRAGTWLAASRVCESPGRDGQDGDHAKRDRQTRKAPATQRVNPYYREALQKSNVQLALVSTSRLC